MSYSVSRKVGNNEINKTKNQIFFLHTYPHFLNFKFCVLNLLIFGKF